MMKNTVAQVVFNIPLDRHFDYQIPEDMTVQEGMRVWAEFSRKKMVGIVIGLSRGSRVKKLKPLSAVLDNTPSLTGKHIRFAAKLAREYPYCRGEFLFTMLPAALKRKRAVQQPVVSLAPAAEKDDSLITCIKRPVSFQRFAVYKKQIETALTRGSVVICVPLVDYIGPLQEKIEAEFPGQCAVFHSYQTAAESLRNWNESRRGRQIIVGTRIALFYYPEDTALLIVEDENNSSYYHPEKPFYHLPDVAVFCSRFNNIPLIISTDYPSLETYKRIQDNEAVLDEVTEKVKAVECIPVRGLVFRNNAWTINRLVLEVLRKHLEDKKKILVLYNRRGFSTFLQCSHCSHVLRCPRCSGLLGFSQRQKKAICFRCNHQEEIPALCPQCLKGYIRSMGTGIEKVESQLESNFPGRRISLLTDPRPGSDIIVSTYGCLENQQRFKCGTADVAMILDSDSYLSRIDYQAALRLFVYLKRLASLAGDKVYAVTDNLEHHLWQTINGDWRQFYKREAELRKEAFLPPYAHNAIVTVRGRDKNGLLSKAGRLYNKIAETSGIEVYGPLPGSPFKIGSEYYYSVVAKSGSRKLLREAVKKATEEFRRGAMRLAVELR